MELDQINRIRTGVIGFVLAFILVNPFHLKYKISYVNNIMRLPTQLAHIDRFKNQVLPRLLRQPNDYSVKQAFSLIPQSFAASDFQNATAYAVIDYDTGKIITQKSLSQRLPIASLTKTMTAIVALDLASPNEVITVSQNAADKIPTKIGLSAGEKLTLKELLHASLMTSANDATQAIADGIDMKYGDQVFVKAMNAKAQYLGLKNSSFANPQGFDNPNNYSTVEDLTILAHYALTHYLVVRDIVKKDYAFIPATDLHKQYDLYNWNGLIGVYPNVSGVKIGNTDSAKMTTIVTAEREGKRLIAVMLGAPGVLERDLWAADLLDAGFETAANLDPIGVTEDQLRAKYATWQYGQ